MVGHVSKTSCVKNPLACHPSNDLVMSTNLQLRGELIPAYGDDIIVMSESSKGQFSIHDHMERDGEHRTSDRRLMGGVICGAFTCICTCKSS